MFSSYYALEIPLLWFGSQLVLRCKSQSVFIKGLWFELGFCYSYWMQCKSHLSPQPTFFPYFLWSHFCSPFYGLLLSCFLIQSSGYYISQKLLNRNRTLVSTLLVSLCVVQYSSNQILIVTFCREPEETQALYDRELLIYILIELFIDFYTTYLTLTRLTKQNITYHFFAL